MPLITERYDLEGCLYSGRATTVYRARRRQGGQTFILKVQKPGMDPARLRSEHSILVGLDAPGVVRASGFEDQGNEVALLLEDHGGETLGARLARGPLPLPEALRIAGEVAGTLGQIHQRRVIHKDINPSNILLDAGGHAWVFDFDIATSLPREIQSIRTPNLLAGTLPYLSPEQTGRMNRAIDYRTDFYSFGVTLYEMLTGRVPFPARDPMELVHCHLAKVADAPSEVDASLPGVVSDIVMKLLEKTAEARYQSGFGLRADLEECRRRLAETGRVDPFPLGREDVSDRFQLPHKLYGRADEIAALEGAFERVREGTPELLLVTGSSGIGKSSVIHELYRSLSRSRGYLVSGKFDQLKRDIPYSALLQALTELVKSLLAEPDAELAVLRQRILAAVSEGGRVLTDVLPDLTRILGPQPPVPELSGAEARNRFRFVFESFIHVFTRHGQPLVLFLDDLQWADAATLELLPTLLGDPRAGALLVIGAYRDNEVSAGHPLPRAVAALEKDGCRLTRVTLGPISAAHVGELVKDALSLPEGEARALAGLVAQRTLGNPLFVGELLKMLHKASLIEFDRARRRWAFDLAQIERAPSTESVGELMAARAAALSARTRRALQLAAVLGERFALETLSIVAESSPEEAADALREALQEGLILSVGQVGQGSRVVYRFLHDRVQQAVYASIPEDAKIDVHHRTGMLLFRSRPEEDHDEWLFDVLHHLNLAIAQVGGDLRTRRELAELNLAAANRAKASGAFAAAVRYHAAGIRFLPERAWASEHALMFKLHLGKAECAFLTGDYHAAEQLFDALLRGAESDLERVRSLLLVSTYKAHIGKLREGVSVCIEALAILGISIDPDPSAAAVFFDVLKTTHAIGQRSPDDILALPEVTEPRMLLAEQVLISAIFAAFFTNQRLFSTLSLKAVRHCMEHGNSSISAGAYVYYGMVLAGVLGEYRAAESFARLALRLTERYPNKKMEARVKFSYGAMICPWRSPREEGIRYLDESWQLALLSGDVTLACFSVSNAAILLHFSSRPLDALQKTCDEYMEFARKNKRQLTQDLLCATQQAALALRGLTQGKGSFTTGDFDEERYVARVSADDAKFYLHVYLGCKIAVLYVLGHHIEAMALSASARKDAEKVLGSLIMTAELLYYDSLLLASLVEDKGAVARRGDLRLLRDHLRTLKKWAENAPMNFQHRHVLVAAELARVTEDDHQAIRKYEEAIRLARENTFLHDEAIALELASKFYRSRGVLDVAITYLARARQAYARWGAHAKVALLDEAYPGLAARAEGDAQRAPELHTTISSSGSAGAFDIPSMVKASQALSGEIALDKLLLRLMNVVAENAGAERGALVLEARGARAVVAEFSAKGGARLPERPVPVGESEGLSLGIVTYVFRTGESVILSDAAREGSFTADAYVASRRPKAVLCMPLLQKGNASGALYLENNLVSGAFTSERAELLSVLSAQMAISIDNAALYADLEQKVIERTRALKQAQARLIQIEKDATELQMAGGFAHEMRNALAGAKLMLAKVYRPTAPAEACDAPDAPDAHDAHDAWSACRENASRLTELFLYLRDHLADAPLERVAFELQGVNDAEEKIDKALGSIDRSLTRGLGITSLILDYAQIGKARAVHEPVPVPALVGAVLHDMRDELAAQGIALDVDITPGCTLVGDELHFHSILKNLVLNAQDALLEAPDAGARAISIRAAEELGQVVLSVRDTGKGIPAGIQERVFEPFFSTKPHKGTGLGLGVVRKLASLYGGVIELSSEEGRGTTFRILFPKDGPEAPVRV